MDTLRALVGNAIVGLLVLVLANALGLGVETSLVTLAICAVLGVPGAVLVVLLAVTDIAFAASVVPLVV
ncbi:MAG: pro-sigmaK processing inhibitor BofA family protein [Halorientalis sp.]